MFVRSRFSYHYQGFCYCYYWWHLVCCCCDHVNWMWNRECRATAVRILGKTSLSSSLELGHLLNSFKSILVNCCESNFHSNESTIHSNGLLDWWKQIGEKNTHCMVDYHRHLWDYLYYLLRQFWTVFVACVSFDGFETILSPENQFSKVIKMLNFCFAITSPFKKPNEQQAKKKQIVDIFNYISRSMPDGNPIWNIFKMPIASFTCRSVSSKLAAISILRGRHKYLL